MEETKSDYLYCEECNNHVQEEDDFCTECGALFTDNLFCTRHTDILADGVCILCALPFCKRCGATLNNHFLCNEHNNYEIFEGMVRVYGTLNDVSAQRAKNCLEQAELHPVIFCRHQPMGGARIVYTLFEAQGDYYGNLVNEIKVMVPCQEVFQSEEILKSLKLLE